MPIQGSVFVADAADVRSSCAYWNDASPERIADRLTREDMKYVTLFQNTLGNPAQMDLTIGQLVMAARVIDAVRKMDESTDRLTRKAIMLSWIAVVVGAISAAAAVVPLLR